MKKFKYTNKATVLRGIKETPKKRRNWDRIVYLAIFITIVVSLLGNKIRDSLIVEAPGEIITDRFSVQFQEDIRVLEYFVEEGDSVEAGDTLLFLKRDIVNQNNMSINLAGDGHSTEWIWKEKMDTYRALQSKRLEQQEKEARIKEVQTLMERVRVQIFLDVKSPLELDKYRDELHNLELAVNILKNEISYLQLYLRELQSYEGQYLAALQSLGSEQTTQYYFSPVAGRVTKIFHPEHEVVYEKTVAMYISDIDEHHIKAYLEQDSWHFYKVGDVVKVSFMDNTKSRGVIKGFYLNTETLPEEFRKVQTKEERSIVADIIPLDDSDNVAWTMHYGLSAKISKFKYNWFKRWQQKHTEE